MRTQYGKTTKLLLCALFTALVAVGAFIRIPVPLVPFTLQFWFTTMAGLLLGPRWGACSVLVYVLLGLMGVPVFTQGGGPGYVSANLRIFAGLYCGHLAYRKNCLGQSGA